MNDNPWPSTDHPDLLLHFLLPLDGNPRKYRLFACACCHRIWHLLKHELSRQALKTCEDFADGLTGAIQLERALREAAMVPGWASVAVANSAVDQIHLSAAAAAQAARVAEGDPHWQSQHHRHCELLHCIFGHIYHSQKIDPSWLRWNDQCVYKIAQGIYAERRFDDMPILGDALEDAGCDDEAILGHCRENTLHARGCWVVDLILAKH